MTDFGKVLCVVCGAAGLAVATSAGSCVPATAPHSTLAARRAEVEAYEDKFCATVASARKLEAATGRLPDAGP